MRSPNILFALVYAFLLIASTYFLKHYVSTAAAELSLTTLTFAYLPLRRFSLC